LRVAGKVMQKCTLSRNNRFFREILDPFIRLYWWKLFDTSETD
jgi:hypothetical protein